MKQFNFINTVPTQTQKNFNNWYKISAVIFTLSVVLMATVSLVKIVKISKIKKEIGRLRSNNSFDEQKNITNQIESQQSQSVEKQIKKLSKWANPKIVPAIIFQDISNLIPADVAITEISYKNKQPIIIKGRTKSLLSVKNFTEKLKDTDWAKAIQIVKIEQASPENSNLSNFELVIK